MAGYRLNSGRSKSPSYFRHRSTARHHHQPQHSQQAIHIGIGDRAHCRVGSGRAGPATSTPGTPSAAGGPTRRLSFRKRIPIFTGGGAGVAEVPRHAVLSVATVVGPPRCQSWDHWQRYRSGTGYRC
jgi:hypothetical protein